MTSWEPDLEPHSGPRYRRIAAALADDIAAGRLKPGDRLPPQRDLAWRLGVTIGTVSRAYEEAERRGIVSGEVGRGTFVRESLPAFGGLPPDPGADGPINFAQNHPIPGAEAALFARTLRELAGANDLMDLLQYQAHLGRPRDRAAGAAFLAATGVAADPAQVAVVSGGQHAISCVLAALTEPGEAIATDALTYPGFRTAAQQRRLRIAPVAFDEQGILPDSLAAICRAERIACLCVSPNLSNPTASVLPLDRREAIVALARRHDFAILEDDVYGFLVDRPPAFATLAPERTLLVNALSKSATSGLRIGYVLAPPDRLDRLAMAVRSTIWMAPPVLAEIATRWIEDGTAAALAAEKRAEAARRMDLARRILGIPGPQAASSYHFWLALPESWRSAAFTAEARRRGVAVTPGEAFAIDRTPPANGIRICVSPPGDIATVERGLKIVAGLMAEEPDALLSVV